MLRKLATLPSLLWIVVLLLAGCTGGDETPATPQLTGDAMRVEEATVRPSLLPNGNSALYLKIVNPTDQADQLVRVESSATERVEFHETVETDGVMRMLPRPEGYEVPAKAVVALEPGGKHIMLLTIAKPLEVGEQISVTLYFATAEAIQLVVPVQEIAGR